MPPKKKADRKPKKSTPPVRGGFLQSKDAVMLRIAKEGYTAVAASTGLGPRERGLVELLRGFHEPATKGARKAKATGEPPQLRFSIVPAAGTKRNRTKKGANPK